MSYSTLFLVKILIDVLNYGLCFVALSCLFMTIASGLSAFIYRDNHMNSHDYESLESEEPTNTAVKYRRLMVSVKKLLIATFITMGALILVPSGKQVTIYLVLRGVDQYAVAHPGSVASPDTLLRAADNFEALISLVSDIASKQY